MTVEIIKQNRKGTYQISFNQHVGVDMNIHKTTKEFVQELSNITYVNHCQFKGDIFTGELRDEEHFMTELVVLFGIFE